MIRFMCLASGSSGNCYYLEKDNQAILIDAGIPMRQIEKALKSEQIPLDASHIQGVLVTHDHADHIRTVGILATQHHLPIYATRAVHSSIDRSRFVQEDVGASRRFVEVEHPFSLIGLDIVAFSVPHDSAQNVGYHITDDEGFSFTLATDIGHITPTIEDYTARANHLVIEANYDTTMLMGGAYPDFLKERVSGKLGHLSNSETAELLSRIYHPEMKHIWLCHLSKDNNHPDLCWKFIENRLFEEGIRVGKDLSLIALKRSTPSPLYLLRP